MQLQPLKKILLVQNKNSLPLQCLESLARQPLFCSPFSLELVGFTRNYLSVFSFANILIKYSQYLIRLQTIRKHTITITKLYIYTKHFILF